MSFRKKVQKSAQENVDKPFLWCVGQTYSYGDALNVKDQFSAHLGDFGHVAIISNSGDIAYLSIFAAVLLDATFMHLSVDWHTDRLTDVLSQAAPDIVVCHHDWASEHSDKVKSLGYDIVPIEQGDDGFFTRLVVFRKRAGQEDPLGDYKAEKSIDDLLYVMFTSGSTGRPKGVPIDLISAEHFAKSMIETFDIGQHERWLQPIDLHFDVSLMTMLPAWITGGHIIDIPANESPFGPRFVKKFGDVENWTSVPSVIARSKALGLLGENVMPGLRRCFFAGEALPSDMASVWNDAAPNASIYNLYGPTEATIVVTWHKFDSSTDSESVVPIGTTLPGSLVRLTDSGEMELGGPQVFHGYLGNPKEISTYLKIDDDGSRWYKSGDLGQLTEQGVLHFKGRKDWQIKLRGYRVEIEGIEAAIRRSTGSSLAAVIPLEEVSQNSYNKLCAFVEPTVDVSRLKRELKKMLPDYMVPRTFFGLNEFPINVNGKVDRNALIKIAETESSA